MVRNDGAAKKGKTKVNGKGKETQVRKTKRKKKMLGKGSGNKKIKTRCLEKLGAGRHEHIKDEQAGPATARYLLFTVVLVC